MFASGDLQDWAEPTLEEQKAWDPVNSGIMKETTFVRIFKLSQCLVHFNNNNLSQNDPNAMTMQINNTKAVNYGAVEHVAGNPFAFPSTITEEPVQPYATDSYMHGSAEEREY